MYLLQRFNQRVATDMAKKDFKSKLDAVLGSIPEGGQPTPDATEPAATPASGTPSAQEEATIRAGAAPVGAAPAGAEPVAPPPAPQPEVAPSLPPVQYPFDADRLMWLAPEHYNRLVQLAQSKNRTPEEVLSVAVSFLLEFYPEVE